MFRLVLYNNLNIFGFPASTTFHSTSRPTAVALTPPCHAGMGNQCGKGGFSPLSHVDMHCQWGNEGHSPPCHAEMGCWWGWGLPGWSEIELRRSILWMVEVGAACKVHAEVPWERVPKCRKVGQRDTLELSQEPGTYAWDRGFGFSCKERAKVPWEQVPKRGKAGQADTSERSQEPDTRGTEGLASAWRLRPHGMPMPYFGWTRLGQGPARTREKQD